MTPANRYTSLQAELMAAPRTWLITGVAGFIGSNLLEQLLKLNQRVIGLDTNVLVRLLVEDDPPQTAAARELLESSLSAGDGCFVSDPVLCELEWVLDSCYGVPRKRILEMLQELAANPHFVFEARTVLRQALDAYEVGKGDFSDYLIGAKARARQARATYTFDRALQNAEGFVVLGPRRR